MATTTKHSVLVRTSDNRKRRQQQQPKERTEQQSTRGRYYGTVVVDGLARDGCGTGERGSSRDYLSGAQQALRYHIWRSDTPQLAKDTPIAGPVTRRHVRCSCQSHDPDDTLTYNTLDTVSRLLIRDK